MAEKNQIGRFIVIFRILPCERDNLKSFSCIIFKFVIYMHVTNNQFSDKFNNGWKKIQNGWLIVIFRILRQ